MSKKRYLDESWDIKQVRDLIEAILKIKKQEEMEKFLTDLLTVKELKEISRRWEVVNLLAKEKNYQEIIRELKITPVTINRVSTKLKHGSGGYLLALEKLHRKVSFLREE